MAYDEFNNLLAKVRVPAAPTSGAMAYDDGGSVDDSLPPLPPGFSLDSQDNTGAVDDSHPPLPPGFTLDASDDGSLPPLPAGFTLDGPTAEGPAASFGRAALHGVVPAAGGLAGAAAGAELGTLVAPFLGPAAPIAPIAGGVLGYFGGATLAGKGQEAALDATGLNDTEQRQANAAEHPIVSTAGDIAPALVTMSPGSLSDALASRVLSSGIMMTAEGVQEGLSGEDLQPGKIAAVGAVGAVFNRQNRFGEAVAAPTAKLFERLKANGAAAAQRYAPGRPDTEPTPTSAQEKEDAQQSEPIKANTRGNAISQPPPPEDVTIGAQPDNKPVRDSGNKGIFAKFKRTRTPPPTTEIPDDVAAALTSDTLLGTPDVGEGDSSVTAARPPEAAAPAVSAPEQPPAAPQSEPVSGQQPQVQPPAPEPVPARVDEPTGIREMFEAKQRAAHPAEPEVLTDEDFAPTDTIRRQNEAAQEVNTEPTEAQKEAGNYKKGHVNVNGLDVTIENPQGSERSGVGPDGKPWSVNMPDHYGYIKRTEGADGDHVDVYLGDTGDKHFIVDQFDPATGKFDEHKIMMNYAGENSARNAYNQAFNDGSGKDRLGAITPVTTDELKEWLKNGDTSKPFNPDAQSAKVSQNTAVVKQALDQLEADGHKDSADAIRAADPNDQPQLATRALRQMGRRSDRPLKEEYAQARVPSKAPLVEGTNITARDKADAARKGNALKAYQTAFDKYAPDEFRVPTSKEDIAALKDRLTAAVTDIDKALGGTSYRASKNPAYAWYKKAKALTSGSMTQKKITDFIASEQRLRGSQEDVEGELATNRIEGGIARSRRSGDAAIASAENAAARESPFEVGPEDIEPDTTPTPIKGAENLPREGVREIDLTKPEDQQALAKALAEPSAPGGWTGVKAEQAAAAEAEAAKTARLRAERLAQKGETKRDLVSSISDEDLAEPNKVAELREYSKEAQKNLLQHFAENESGAVDLPKFLAAVKQSTRLPWKGDKPIEIGDMFSSSLAAREAPRAGEPKTSFSRDEVPASEDFGRDVDNNMYQLGNQHDDHVVMARKMLDQAGDNYPALKDRPAFEDMYRAIERGQESTLPQAWQKAVEDEVKPMLEMNSSIRNLLRERGEAVGDDVDNYIMRIPKNNQYDPFAIFKADDPIGAVRAIATGKVTPQFDRKFKALENANGQRRVISLDDDGNISIWNRYKQTRAPLPGEWEQGGTLELPNKAGTTDKWKMTDAYTDEIEKNALGPADANGKRYPMQYYKNPLLSAYLANVKLSDHLRNVEFVDQLKKSNLFRQYAMPPGTSSETIPNDWRKVDLPNLKDWFLHPDVADVIDDYTKPGLLQGAAADKLRNVSNALLRTLFITPTAHIFNVGAHWFSGRGWDNFTPYGVGRLMKTMPEAIKSVMTQDPTQSLIRQSMGGTMYGGVLSRDMLNTLAEKAGEQMAKDPERWGPMFAKLGMNKPADYVSAIYNASSHVMWAVNDMLVTQRFLENRMKGMTVQGALNDVYRDIPNYRIPSKVMGSRAASQFMQDNLFATFNRYHYGMMNAWANLVKDLLGKDATKEERIAAAGKLAAIGFAMFVAKPVLDHLVKSATGNPDAEMHARGPLTIPEGLAKTAKTGDFSNVVSSLLPMSPVVQTATEAIHNKDFSGRPIAKPADVINAAHGSPTAAGRIALDETTHAAKGLVAPVNTVLNAMGRAQNEGQSPVSGLGQAARDQLLDIRNPSIASRRWEHSAGPKAQKALRQDLRKPRDPLERLYDRMFGAGQSHF